MGRPHDGCSSCRGVGRVCENHPAAPWSDTVAGGCTCGAGMACPAQPVEVGCYIRPVDVADDPDAIHSHEGTCWAIEQLPDPASGELVDHLHVVHVNNGALMFSMLPIDRVGSVSPPNTATIDGLVRLAGKQFVKTGRRTERRVFALVHSAAAVLAQPQMQPEMPSVFGDDDATAARGRQVCGSCGRTLNEGVCKVHGVDQQAAAPNPVLVLVARFEHLGGTEQNEIRRAARLDKLPYLEIGAELELQHQVAYDVLIARWERHLARAAS
jgi:hypothetical protein